MPGQIVFDSREALDRVTRVNRYVQRADNPLRPVANEVSERMAALLKAGKAVVPTLQ